MLVFVNLCDCVCACVFQSMCLCLCLCLSIYVYGYHMIIFCCLSQCVWVFSCLSVSVCFCTVGLTQVADLVPSIAVTGPHFLLGSCKFVFLVSLSLGLYIFCLFYCVFVISCVFVFTFVFVFPCVFVFLCVFVCTVGSTGGNRSRERPQASTFHAYLMVNICFRHYS